MKKVFLLAILLFSIEIVYFKFTAITSHHFVCENGQHDFPKMISYQKEGNKIKATISGDGKSFDYLVETNK